MADARYVIDLILKARDDTASGVASMAKNLGVANGLIKQQGKEADELGRRWDLANEKIGRGTDKLAKDMRRLSAANSDVLQGMSALEKSAQEYERTRNRSYDTELQRIAAQEKALDRLRRAETSLRTEINRSNEGQRQSNQTDAEGVIRRLRQSGMLIEKEKDRIILVGKAAQAQEAADKREAESAKRLMTSRTALNLQRLDEEESTHKKLVASRTALRNQQLDEEEDTRKKLVASRTALNNQRLNEEEETAKKLVASRTALNLQRLDEEAETAKKLVASQTALNHQRLDEEEDAHKKLVASRTALRNQQLDEEEETAKRLVASRTALNHQRLDEEEETAKRLIASQTALSHQRMDEEEETAKKLAAFRTAMAHQRLDEEEETHKKLVASRTALRNQQLDEEEETAKKLAAFRTAINNQRLDEEEEINKKLIASRTALLNQQLDEEEEAAKKLAAFRTAMNHQRLDEEEETHRKLVASRSALRNQQLDEEEAAAKKLAAFRTAVNKQRLDEEEAWTKNSEDLHDRYLKSIQRASEAEGKLRNARTAGAPENETVQLEIESGRAVAEAEALREKLRALLEHIQANVDLDPSKFEAEAAIVEGLKTFLAADVEVKVKADIDHLSFLRAKESTEDLGKETESTSGGFSDLFKILGSGSGNIASFDNAIRGVLALGITVFLQQLIQIGGAAVGMLLALASSAVQAGAALGGALAAGAAQAIPVVGVLATAFSRVKGVLDAVKQANLLQQQQSYQGAKADNTQANASDALANALDGVANAHRGVLQAQESLTKARRDAVRNLQDLILAERAAELAAKGASLSQEESQQALQAAIASGQGVSRAQLGVEDANLGVDQAKRSVQTAGAALVAGSVPEQTDGVRRAKEALLDAQRAAASAERSVDRARRASDLAAAGVTAASGKLDYLKSQMSAAELTLFNALTRLQKRFQDFGRNISSPIINAFAFAANRATRLLGDKSIIGAAKGLSDGIADAFKGIFKSFTTPETIKQILGFAKDAKANLIPLAAIIRNLGHTFLDLGGLGSGTLKHLLGSIKDITTRMHEFVTSVDGKHQIREYFHEGLGAVKSFGELLYNIIRLFLAISGAGGAKAGTSAVKDLGQAVGDMADAINTKGSKAREFFEKFFTTSREIINALGPILTSLANEFQKTFNEDGVGSVKGFANIMANVLIPAFGDFVRHIGQAGSAVGKFLDSHPQISKYAGSFVGMFLAVAAVGKVFGILTGTITGFGKPLLAVGKYIGTSTGALSKFGSVGKTLIGFLKTIVLNIGFLTARLPLLNSAFLSVVDSFGAIGAIGTGPLLLIVGVIALVLLKLGLLDDAVRAVKGFFTAFWAQMKPPVDRFIAAMKDLVDTFGSNKGLMPVIRSVVKHFIDFVGVILKLLGSGLGEFFGGILDVVTGLVQILTGLLTLDFSKMWEGLKTIGSGLGHILLGIIKTAFGAVLAYITFGPIGWGLKIVSGIAKGLLLLGAVLVGVFVSAVKKLLDWLGIASPSKRAATWGKAILDGFLNGLAMLGELVLKIFQAIPGLVLSALKGYARIARAIVDLILDGLKLYIKAASAVGRWIYNAIKDAVQAVASLYERIGKAVWNFIKGAIQREISGFKAIGRWIYNAIKAAIDAVGDLLGRIGKAIWGFLKEAIRREISGFKNIGTWIYNAVKDAIEGVGEKLKDVGGTIIKKLAEGLKAARNIFRDAIRSVIKEMPGGAVILKAIDKVGGVVSDVAGAVGDKLGLATGGPVPGSGSGDTVPAMLTPGEHVLTKREVAAAGGHGVIFALRRMLGGGTQGGPSGYAGGGTVFSGANDFALRPVPRTSSGNNDVGLPTAAEVVESKRLTALRAADAKAARETEAEDRKKELATTREDYQKSNTERATKWRIMWNDLVITARRGANDVEEQFRDMRVNTTKSLTALYHDGKDQIAALQDSINERGADISSSWAGVMNAMTSVTYAGLKYIGDQMGKALKALGGKVVDLGLSTPTNASSNIGGASTSTDHTAKGRYASGGFVGNPGERGRDAVPTLLGRGEVVLNYAQQAAANAAMSGRSSLGGILRSVRGYHAGGPGAPGLATGGGDVFDGHPSNVNDAVKKLIELMKSKFPLVVTSTTDHSRLTTSGNVSDHTTGAAVDLSGNNAVMLKAAQWVKSSGLYKKIKQGIHNPNLAINAGQIQDPPGQFAGAVWAQHANHIHLAITGALSGAFRDAVGDGVSNIRAISVRGSGAVRDIAQRALDTVRSAANAKLNAAGGDADVHDGDTPKVGQGAKGREIFRYFKQAGFTDNQAAAWVGNFVQESGLNPSAVQPNGEGHGLGQWGGDRFASLQAFAAQRHAKWTDLQTQLDFVIHELNGSERSAYSAIKAAKGLDDAVNAVGTKYERYGIRGDRSGPAREALAAYGGEFATGGQVPGGEGKPVVITAHAGEWVLNKLQQSKLASAVGTGVGKLRDYLGFSGGPSSFADGGEVSGFQSVRGLVEDERHEMRMAALKGKNHADERKREEETHKARLKNIAEEEKAEKKRYASLKLPDDQRLSNISRGVYANALVSAPNIQTANREENRVGRAQSALGIPRAAGGRLDQFVKNLGALTNDTSGLIGQAMTQIETQATRAATALTLAKNGMTRIAAKAGAASRLSFGKPLTDAVAIADREIGDLKKAGDQLAHQATVIAKNLADVNTAIKNLRKGGITSDETTAYQALIGQRNALQISLDDADAKIAQNRADKLAKQQERFNAQTEKLLRPGAQRQARLDTGNKVAAIFGRDDPVDYAAKSAKIAVDNQKIAQQQYNVALAKAKSDPRWKAIADERRVALQTATVDAAQATHDAIQAPIDAINKRYDDAGALSQIKSRIAAALGDKGAQIDIAEGAVNSLKAQQAELQAQLAKIGDRDPGAKAALEKQIADLGASITEGTQQIFQDRIAKTEAEFQRATTKLDLAGRVADFQEKIGNRLGAAQSRIGIAGQRVDADTTERNGLQDTLNKMLAQPATEQNTEAVKDLQEKIAALDQTIVEDTEAVREATLAYRETATDIVTGKADRSTGLIGTAGNIYDKIAANAGVPNTQGLDIAKRQRVELDKEKVGIVADAADSIKKSDFGAKGNSLLQQLSDAFAKGPEAYADVLKTLAPDIADFESTLGDATPAWQKLTGAMTDNTIATLDNTKTTKELDGSLQGPQNFSTTSWSWLGKAMFNGMGGVLPQYAVPHMATGGSITKGGIFELHPGEFVVNPQGTNVPDSGDIHITMNSVDGNVDMTALASRIAFAKKNRG